MSLKGMPKSFYLTCKEDNYTHFFNTAKNLVYEGQYPETEYYGEDFMSGDERAQFSEWYDEQRRNISK
jgi:hypothetical protein